MLQRLLSAVFTKLDCSIFSLMFLLFRWREAYFNGTGRWIFKKTGVRKTTVIASIMLLIELVLFFTEIMREHSLPSSAQTRAIPSVARPIFVARMKGYVMTILNQMLSCFRSNYRSTESGLKKYVMRQNLVALAQTWAYSTAARPIFVAMMKVYIKTIQNHMLPYFRSKNRFAWSIFTKFSSMARPCCFCPTQAHSRCCTLNLRYWDDRMC